MHREGFQEFSLTLTDYIDEDGLVLKEGGETRKIQTAPVKAKRGTAMGVFKRKNKEGIKGETWYADYRDRKKRKSG